MRVLYVLDRFEPLTRSFLLRLKDLKNKAGFSKVFLCKPKEGLVLASDPIPELLSLSLENEEGFEWKWIESGNLNPDANDENYLFDAKGDSYIPLDLKSNKDYPVSDLGQLTRLGSRLDLTKRQLEFIVTKKIWFASLLDKFLTQDRLNHVLSVSLTAIQLASLLGYDTEKAAIAGLYHDLGKDLEVKKQREVCERLNVFVKEDYALHQYVSAQYAKELFGIDDEEILSAIRCHCTGKKEMTLLDRILYASDKIEPKRKFDNEKIRLACFSNFKTGFPELLRWQIGFFEKNGVEYATNPDTRDMYETYLGGIHYDQTQE